MISLAQDKIKLLFLNLFVAVAYWACAKLSLFLAFMGTSASPIWPAAGIATAAFLLYGNRIWLGIFLGALAGNFFIDPIHFNLLTTLFDAFFPAVGATLQAALGAWALNYFAHTNNPFKTIYAVFIFVTLSAMCACMINASIGISTRVLTGMIPQDTALYAWFTWWIGDMIGVLVITPTLVAWFDDFAKPYYSLNKSELVALLIAFVIVSVISSQFPHPLFYLFIPLILWACFRFNPKYSTLIGLLIAALTIYQAIYGVGPFKYFNNVNNALIAIQGFVGTLFIVILALQSLLMEREINHIELSLSNTSLQKIIEQRNRDIAEKNNQMADILAYMENSKITFSLLLTLLTQSSSSIVNNNEKNPS